MPKVYIIVLNYKNFLDTIECLESLLKINYINYQLLLIDNNSPNDSWERLLAWASGKEEPHLQPHPVLAHLSLPLAAKPLHFSTLVQQISFTQFNTNQKLVFIRAHENKGYAAGNNIGLAYAIDQNDADYYWILNNDVVVEPDSLSELIKKAAYYEKAGKKIGIIGAKIMYYHSPELIQGAGGANFYPWTARQTVGIGAYEKDKGQYDKEVSFYFTLGSCMLLNKKMIDEIGLLNEEYFLYYEEPDLAINAYKHKWLQGYAWKAKIYHKEGGSSGGGTHRKDRASAFAEYYYQRSKILFTRRYYPQFLPFVYLNFLMVLLKKIFFRQGKRIPQLLAVLFNPKRIYNNISNK